MIFFPRELLALVDGVDVLGIHVIVYGRALRETTQLLVI
jgi:hypothetical protein